ncbi:MAG TPA: ClpX C4-type zinc finger protein [Candidatus Angelobacter sp.]|nr:ClpX C4-type zinc finger protein [Candidatus Angelobacter sp.]
MVNSLHRPPPVLHSARVLEYALLDKSVSYSGHSSVFVDGQELGPVPCLAVCQSLDDDAILLLHCTVDWSVLGVVEYSSVAEAKNRTEHIYRGSSKLWIETHTTPQEAAQDLETIHDEPQCRFCGKGTNEIEQLVSKNHANICDLCITEFHQMLHDHSEVKN